MELEPSLALANTLCATASTGCMLAGFAAIRGKRKSRHRVLMLGAFTLAALFLIGFVIRFVKFGFHPFAGHGARRAVYLATLFSHEPLAVVNVPLVVVALLLALRGSYATHREVARIAFPVWLYVSITGVALYLFLYI